MSYRSVSEFTTRRESMLYSGQVFPAGPMDAQRDFAPVRDQDFLEHAGGL